MALVSGATTIHPRLYKFMIRSFWPVGQGAFYSELFRTSTAGKRGYSVDSLVVYDCGSNDKATLVDNCISKLEKRCRGRKTIDILFISHFHSDHISHINQLISDWRVRLIVLPVISPEVIIDAYLQNYVSNAQQNPHATDLLQTLFSEQSVGDAKILRVSPATEDDHPGLNEQNQLSIDSLLSEQISDIHSGFSLRFPFWEYIPCNYLTRKSSTLVDVLKTLFPDLYHAFLNSDWEGIRFHLGHIPFQVIADLYKNTYSDQNEESMTVLSRPLIKTYPQRIATCLYTGDSPFRKKRRLRFIMKFYGRYWKQIGTIQVSHHGCGIDNPQELYDHAVTGVMCYGTTNTYGHPAIETFINIATPKGDARIVTESSLEPYQQRVEIV